MAVNVWHLENSSIQRLCRELVRYRVMIQKQEQQLQNLDKQNSEYYQELMRYAAAKHHLFKMEHILQKNSALKCVKQEHVATGSVVHLRSRTSHRYILLVDPVQSDPLTNRVSINSSLGRNLLGKHINDTIRLPGNGVDTRYTIESIG